MLFETSLEVCFIACIHNVAFTLRGLQEAHN